MSKVNSKNILKLKDEVPHTLFHNYKQRINPPTAYSFGEYGNLNQLCMTSDGSIIAIGEASISTVTGYVAIYKRIKDRFTLLQTINATDNVNAQDFASCAISANGKILIVGSYSANVNNKTSAGKVSIFSNNSPGSPSSSWVIIQQNIIQSVPNTNNNFGYTLKCSFDGTYILIGAFMSTADNTSKLNSIEIYKRDSLTKYTWSFVQFINSSLRNTFLGNYYFGPIVSMTFDAKYIIVGDDSDNTIGLSSGAAYLFYNSNPSNCRDTTPSTWILLYKFIASDASISDRFGTSVAICQNGYTFAVGAYNRNSYGTNGAIYIYQTTDQWSTYTETEIISPNSTPIGAYIILSHSVKYLATGTFSGNGGSVFIWKKNGIGNLLTSTVKPTWKLHQKIKAPDDTSGNDFGYCIVGSYDIKHLLIGSPDIDSSGVTDSGAVYYFNAVDGYPFHNSVQYDSTSVSGSITMTNRNNVLIVKSTLTGSLTINLPTDLINGKQVYIHIMNGGTQALTFSPAVIGWTNTTTVGTFQVFSLIYIASTNLWYRV